MNNFIRPNRILLSYLVKIQTSVKYIHYEDFVAIGKFCIIIIPAYIYKIYLRTLKKSMWLISEGQDSARDNAYAFYEYLYNNHPDDNFYYAVSTSSHDYKMMPQRSNIVEFGTLKHWLYYLAATKNISSQKSGNPNPALFYVLHTTGLVKGNRVFLGHGVTINNAKYLYKNVTKFQTFLCAAKLEREYVISKFGYEQDEVAELGLPRFDKLIRNSAKAQVVLMPTWRDWLGRDTNRLQTKTDFTKTEYYRTYQSLINNAKLIQSLEENNITLIVFLHPNMQKYSHYFRSNSKMILIKTTEDVSINQLINESSLMISDYSSITMDFGYLNKPLIYYQFDHDEYRNRQYSEGYFDYKLMGFGPVLKSEHEVVDQVLESINNKFVQPRIYGARVRKFYTYNDDQNCKRLYMYLKSSKK